jgi:hypothetical protein
VRNVWCISVCVLLLGAVCSAAEQRGGAPADELFGTWTGSWEGGGGSGGFELKLDKGKDGATGGGVSVTGEPAYQATLKTISFDGKKMTAAYDFPPDERVEVILAATFDGDTAKGTWSLREKGGSEALSGTWTVKKK